MNNTYHVPVLLKESINGLNILPNGVYVDATFGGGGHTKEILNHLNSFGKVIAFDQDADAIENQINDNRLKLIKSNFKYLTNHLKYLKINKNVKFLRAMPNTSSRFDLGITALFNCSFQKTDMAYIKGLFKKFGRVIELDYESKMDQFTGLVGSGPAYFFYLLKTYEKELLKMCNGNKDEVAAIMTNLLEGVSKSIQVNDNLDELIKMVASKKGTTEAGLKSFSTSNINKIFKNGLKKAIERSKEISNEY